MNEEKYKNFCKRTPVICDAAITATIKNNPLTLLSSFDPVDDKAFIRKRQEKKKKSLIKLLVQVSHTLILLSRSVSQHEVPKFPSLNFMH